MEEIKESVDKMWQGYLASLDLDERTKSKLEYESWYFCDNENDANHLGQLVKTGVKSATASLVRSYEVEEEAFPLEGELSIITDYNGQAVCLIKTVKVQIIAFDEVTEAFAYKEGEGDKSLTYWKKAHIEFFTREMKSYEEEFDASMNLVCEEFEVVYK